MWTPRVSSHEKKTRPRDIKRKSHPSLTRSYGFVGVAANVSTTRMKDALLQYRSTQYLLYFLRQHETVFRKKLNAKSVLSGGW